MIFLEPKFGLANRLRVIASGIDLGQETNKEVTIVWENTHELNCSFEELFNPIKNLIVIKKEKHHFFTKNNSDNLFKNIIPSIINKSLGIDFCIKTLTASHLKRGASSDIFKIANSKENIYIATCDQFYGSSRFFAKFKPVSEIQARISEIISKFNSGTIGLHIRRTDHFDAIGNSPLSLFVDKIQAELVANPEINFYLSTDDPSTEKYLKEIFGSKIITYEKDFSRDTPQGIKDAVLDMFGLAHTKKIYGSFNSSFSDVASKIGNIPLNILAT